VDLYLHILVHLHPLHRDIFTVLSLSFLIRKVYNRLNCRVFLAVQYQPYGYTSVSFVAKVIHVCYFWHEACINVDSSEYFWFHFKVRIRMQLLFRPLSVSSLAVGHYSPYTRISPKDRNHNLLRPTPGNQLKGMFIVERNPPSGHGVVVELGRLCLQWIACATVRGSFGGLMMWIQCKSVYGYKR
jgi:hypothetical protein